MVFNMSLTTYLHWSYLMVPLVIPLEPMVPLIEIVGIIGRTLSARTVFYTVRVRESRFSDRGQTKYKHCIVTSESWGIDFLTLRGLTKSIQYMIPIKNRIIEGITQGLTKSMQSIVPSDRRFLTLRDLTKSMHCIVPMKKG